MSTKDKINCLREVQEIIDQMGGMNEEDFINAGIRLGELDNADEEVLARLRRYRDAKNAKQENSLGRGKA